MECLTSKYAAMKLLSFYIHIKNIAFSFRKENNARRLPGMDAAMAATIALKE